MHICSRACVGVRPQFASSFLAELPCLLRDVPSTPGPFHVVRFGCWGARYAEDRINGSRHDGGTGHDGGGRGNGGGRGTSDGGRGGVDTSGGDGGGYGRGVYLARAHTFNVSEHDNCRACAVAYGGAHVTLVQRATVGELIGYLSSVGVMPIDLALRASPGKRQFPMVVHASGRAGRFEKGVANSIRSYVVDTPLVWMTWGLSGTWRSPKTSKMTAGTTPTAATATASSAVATLSKAF
eukprot:2539959-Pleurochrysis_carterae.AAC.1